MHANTALDDLPLPLIDIASCLKADFAATQKAIHDIQYCLRRNSRLVEFVRSICVSSYGIGESERYSLFQSDFSLPSKHLRLKKSIYAANSGILGVSFYLRLTTSDAITYLHFVFFWHY